jgi:acetyl-CoA carboxylase biotin carboxyl carrier protein
MATPRRTPPATAAPPAGDERVVELTRRLAGVLTELGLSEVEVESADVRVRVQKTSVVAPAVVAPTGSGADGGLARGPLVGESAARPWSRSGAMVGTFYRASSPPGPIPRQEATSSGRSGALHHRGDEAEMNEIESKTAGRVARILVEIASR